MASDSIVWKFIPRAENLARMWHRQHGGDRRGIDIEECLSAAAELLGELSEKYDPSKGSVVNLLALTVPRKLNHTFARQLRGETETIAAEEPPEGEAPPNQERAAQLEQLRAWAGTNKERLALLAALDSGAALCSTQSAMLRELRQEMAGESPHSRCRLWTTSKAARVLKTTERRVRVLCEDGKLPAVRDRGWLVSRRDVSKLLERVVKDNLRAGATTREAGKVARVSHVAAARRLRQMGEQRPRGRRPILDPAEVLSALTDETRAPAAWRRGYPSLRRVAHFVGCDPMTVVRVHRQLTRPTVDNC